MPEIQLASAKASSKMCITEEVEGHFSHTFQKCICSGQLRLLTQNPGLISRVGPQILSVYLEN